MDRWDRSLAAEDHRRRNRRENPSFSSTLLDAIYRSIDEGEGEGEGDSGERDLIFCRETMRKKQSDDSEMVDFRRACMIEKWMEKKVTEKVVVRRNSVHNHDFMLLNSSSSSSDSSGFSSSESESKSRSSSSCSSYGSIMQQRPKPIRTSVSGPELEKYARSYDHNSGQKQKQKNENGFMKTKSKALKIYGDLKKVKQPISPGGRLASFLNSLFTAGNTKKPPKKKIHDDLAASQMKSKSTNTSTCSSASSFSRSCLTKTPSSRGTKRSVRFCPVSVIVDEDCRPCGHKNLHEDIQRQQQQQQQEVVDYNRRRVQEVIARDLLLKSYNHQKKNDNMVVELDMRHVHHNDNVVMYDNENDDDDDDAASYSSSDLFELDNLSAIGIERYSEELPVYETTHFDTNRAIANGLIL
uniref:protein BIG GRAIN 1-like A isoform X1 n=1 Tax=Ziziphus jujuba TaxID=326968 RepID=A0A6P3YQA2_ZIZJJ